MTSLRLVEDPPEDFHLIRSELQSFYEKMKAATQASHEGKRKKEANWEIFALNHQKSLYIYKQYTQKIISKELYEYCISERLIDAALIAKWKQAGFESLCCLQCINSMDTNFNTQCMCRVPLDKRETKNDKIFRCINCGCTGCSH